MYALLLSCLLGCPPVAPPVLQSDTPVSARRAAPPAGGLDSIPHVALSGIVVTVARTAIPLRESPAATTVVDRINLRTMPRAVAVDEAVRLVPGLKVDNQADGERVHASIRGRASSPSGGCAGSRCCRTACR